MDPFIMISEGNNIDVYIDQTECTNTYETQDLSMISSDVDEPTLRRSQRETRRPTHLQDYHCNTTQKLWCGLVKYKFQTNSVQGQHFEPRNYKTVLLNPKWKEAMDRKIHALEKNNTWT